MSRHLHLGQSEAVQLWRSENASNPEWTGVDDGKLHDAYNRARRAANNAAGRGHRGRAGSSCRGPSGLAGRQGSGRGAARSGRGRGGRGVHTDGSGRGAGGNTGLQGGSPSLTWDELSGAFLEFLSMPQLQTVNVDFCYEQLREIAAKDSTKAAAMLQLHAAYRERMQRAM